MSLSSLASSVTAVLFFLVKVMKTIARGESLREFVAAARSSFSLPDAAVKASAKRNYFLSKSRPGASALTVDLLYLQMVVSRRIKSLRPG